MAAGRATKSLVPSCYGFSTLHGFTLKLAFNGKKTQPDLPAIKVL